MSLSVVGVLLLTSAGLATGWGRSVLTNEDRYLRAVARLPESRRVARIAAWSVSMAARHRPGWRQGVSPRTARFVGAMTRRTMRTARFGIAWGAGHRWMHRARGRDRRVAVAMLLLAAGGEVVGVAGWVGATAVRLRRASCGAADRRVRATGRPHAW